MYRKNTASQKVVFFAYDSTTNAPKTGDAANITAYLSKDDGSLTILGDTSATEISSTNAKGYYSFDLTQTETNATKLFFSAKSSTANVVVRCVPDTFWTVPVSAGGLEQVDTYSIQGSEDAGSGLLTAGEDYQTGGFAQIINPFSLYSSTGVGTTSSLVCSNLSDTVDGRMYRGQIIKIDSGTYAGKQVTATSYDSGTKTLQFTPHLDAAFGNGVSFILLPTRPNRLSG